MATDEALERRRAYDRARYTGARKEAVKARAGAYYARHPEKVKAQATAWNKANPEARRRVWLKRTYGITPEDFDRMLLEQNGRCGICGTDVDLVIDHDHATGRVRGLLCRRCNRTLGQFEDDRDLVRRALEWLED